MNHRLLGRLGVVAAAWLLLSSTGSALAQAQTVVPTSAILVGQSGGFTGGQAEYARDVRTGIEAALAAANARGGISGRPVRLVTADDGGKRDAVLVNTRKLVEVDNVVGLIGYTSGAGTEGTLAYLQQMRVPMLSPATGNMGIREAANPHVFHTRAGYDDEMAKIIGHVARLGYKRVALAYLDDVGPANLRAMTGALAKNGLSAATVVGLNRNADDFTPQVDKLMASQPQIVVFISNAKPIVNIVRGMRARGYGGQFATSSFAGSRLVADLKEHAPGLILIQVLPQPRKNHLQFHREFHADLAALSPQVKANYTILEGYVAGRVLLEGLRRSGPGVTRGRLQAALEALPELDYGGYRIRLGTSDRSGSRFVDLGVVTDDLRLVF
ncbi:MAG: ABC transporter substrate-binding protein [Rubrivivax sp.]